MMIRRLIQTRDGEFAAWFSEAGLCRLEFPPPAPAMAGDGVGGPLDAPQFEAWFQLTCCALLEALNGRNVGQLPPLDLSAGTDFQRRVWQALLQIPAGQTRTYQEIADRLRAPGAARAVGAGCGANRIPVLVPC